MHSLMSMVRCLYLCLDVFRKEGLLQDKTQFNKKVFHYRVDLHLHFSLRATELSSTSIPFQEISQQALMYC